MELTANSSAQFFLQDEYRQIALQPESLILSSPRVEEKIPFSVWNGQIKIERGLLWGTITIYAHNEENKRVAWQVQGLPWKGCKLFAREALEKYQQWHKQQCSQLYTKLPQWEEELRLLIKQPAYLADSSLYQWRDMLVDDLQQMSISLEEARQKLPEALEFVASWLDNIENNVDERNEHWLEQERKNWEVLFNQIEHSPLNLSQQQAVLLNNDHNLVLAGAGTGKTSVLTSRIAYLLQSHLAQAEEMLMLAFGRDAANEMQSRVSDKIGLAAEKVAIHTFHQLGLKILNTTQSEPIQLSPLATDDAKKKAWCSAWLKEQWTVAANYKRWQKHLSNWPIAYLKGDDELIGQTENPKLTLWISNQLDHLCMAHQSKKELQQRLIADADYPRLNSELSLLWPCYQAWQKELKENNLVDFHSMITRATKVVQSGKFKSPWKYIMVDEYQDISPDRLQLIEALCTDKKESKQASLFAVGDDWQSIYQFSGSDVDLTTGFADRFVSSTIHSLDIGYRFNSKIAEVADRFIQKNSNQLAKEITSFTNQKQKAVYVIANKKLEKTLADLNRKCAEPVSVLMLGRNHYHKPDAFDDWSATFSQLQLDFKTCHASKGKEADYVFIVGVDEGQFPAVERQPHIGAVICANSDNYPHAEERRLFYVALTRAKHKVWIVSGASQSCFVEELISDGYAIVKKN